MMSERIEIEYRLRHDGITLHVINASSRQQIADVVLSKAGAQELLGTLSKLIPLVPEDAKEQETAP